MYKYDKNIKFNVTDEQVTYILNSLPSSYLDDYMKWLTVTNVLKGLKNMKVLWEKWSMQSSSYNEYNNNKIWRGIKDIKFDLNYLINIINRETSEKLEYLSTYKEFKPLQFNYNPVYVNDKYVTNIFNYDDFKQTRTAVIQSCTGTGKTTAIAKHMKEYISNDDTNVYKILSIIDKISLGAQHLESFKKEQIHLRSYHDGFKKNEHYYVCINSLLQLENLSNSDIEQYIVFIDEINSFLQFTHNHHISNLKRIYNLLLRIIKNAKKVIVSDNMICDNVFELLDVRQDENIKFIINEFQRFEGVEAYKIRDANSYLQILKKHIENKKYFLFGCDSAEVVIDYYNHLIKDVTQEDVSNNFILITAKHPFEIGNASETFKDKYVFYSPSITTAVDFSIDQAQDVFIYIKGDSIDASSSFQQMSRTRNIRKLFYYAETKSKEAEYESLDELRALYKSYIIQSEEFKILKNVCETLDDEYNVVLNEDKFFNMFTYNEYNADIFKTNRCIMFENILKTAKFKLCLLSDDNSTTLNKDVKVEMKEATKEQKEKLFNEFLQSENKDLNKFSPIVERMTFLNVPNDNKILEQYKDIITDDKVLDSHLNLIRLLKSDDYIKSKLNKIDGETFKVKTIDTIYNKIHIIRNFEKSFNIKPLEVDYKTSEPIEIKDELWAFVKKLFRSTKNKPKDMQEFKPIYISMIKNICDSDMIDSKQVRDGKKFTRLYSLNTDYIKEHLKLNQYINPMAKDFQNEFIEVFKIEPNEELIKQKNINFKLLDF
jgi:hypothetical protein